MATFDAEHPILGTTVLASEQEECIRSCMPVSEQFSLFWVCKAVNILPIFTDLGSSFGAIGDPKNQVFDIKSGHDFCRYRNSARLSFSDQWVISTCPRLFGNSVYPSADLVPSRAKHKYSPFSKYSAIATPMI